jgi:hypothetical protein
MNIPTITIEKNIPVPFYASEDGKLSRYPFYALAVGESFLVPRENGPTIRSMTSIANKSGKRFTCRKVEGGLRVWRVS